MSNYNLEEWRRNRPPQPNEMSPIREAMYRAQRANKPILNQAGTFMHGGGTFDEFDYEVPGEVDFDTQLSRGDFMESDTGWGPLNQAAQGRFGDSMMRNVDGEQAHVNPVEAAMIDNYGREGQRAVKSQGAGTINPKTGKKEYWIPLALGLAGLGVQAYGAYRANQAAQQGYDDALGYQQEALAGFRKQKKMGRQFMDPNSAQNQMYLQNIERQGLNQVALQNQLANRNAAAYGGGFSGAQAQQAQQAGLQAGLQGRQQWLGMMGQQQQTGVNLLQDAWKQQTGIHSNMAELAMARGAGESGAWTSGTSGFGQGLSTIGAGWDGSGTTGYNPWGG